MILNFAEYDYIIDEATLISDDEDYIKSIRSMNNHKIGFIAQDIVNTEIGSQIITQSTSDGLFGYDTGNLTSVIAGALQEEMKRRENLESEVANLKNEIEDLKSIISEIKGSINSN